MEKLSVRRWVGGGPAGELVVGGSVEDPWEGWWLVVLQYVVSCRAFVRKWFSIFLSSVNNLFRHGLLCFKCPKLTPITHSYWVFFQSYAFFYV